MEENKTLSVLINMTHANGRFHFNLSTSEEINPVMMRAILAGGLALSIKAEDSPENQGKAMKDVIDYLTSEFISTDSFENAQYIISTTPPVE